MKNPTRKQSWTVPWAALCAAIAAFVPTTQAQVTFQQVTNGLVDYYPLEEIFTNTGTTPDYISRRDMTVVNMTPANIISATRPGGNSSKCINLNQSGGATVIYYNTTGQNPLDGSGDFLPFCDQVNATMNFWIKGNATNYTDKRFFGECDTTGNSSNPLFLFGSSSGTTDGDAHFLFRQQDATGPDGSSSLEDGTYEFPVIGYYWQQGNQSTSLPVLDGNWHMFTVIIDTNRFLQTYVDGVQDIGTNTGSVSIGPGLPLTNAYYTTNIYPAAGASNPPPNGFVRWVFKSIFKTGNTCFGGFKRGGITGGFPMEIDDIAFWNRSLSSNEIVFVMTNGLPGITLNTNAITFIDPFSADFSEIGSGDSVTLRWNISGVSTAPGSIVISGVGDVSALGANGSTNITLAGNATHTFTLTAHNAFVQDKSEAVSIKSFKGVDVADWHLVQRFDGLFTPTSLGISGFGWSSKLSDYRGSFDRWNVVTVTNSGKVNTVMAPRSGYQTDTNISLGSDTRGAMAVGQLNGLTIPPNQANTLFFRFSLQEPGPAANGLVSDMDCGIGVSDENFAGPLSDNAGPGNAGNVGPFFSIIRNSLGNFNGGPFTIYAQDYSGSSVTNSYNYTNSTTGDPNGLQTNVNYLVWMDIQNFNTQSNNSTTINEPQFSVWLMKEGDAGRTQLFSNFHGNRDFVGFNPVNDNPTPYLSQIFASIGDADITTTTNQGAYFSTNMIALDDFYLSKSGFNGTIPKLFDVSSVVRGSTSVTVTWDSLGSMYGTNTYSVLRKLNLNDAAWTTLTNGMPSGGDTSSFVDTTIGSASQAYYKISWP